MTKKFYSLRLKMITLISALGISIIAVILFFAQQIFQSYYVTTCKNYMYDLCMSAASTINVSANDGTNRTNVKIKYLLQNLSLEGMDSLEVALIDSEGKYIYSYNESDIGRYVSQNEVIDNLVHNMKVGKFFTADVEVGKVNGISKYVAYTKTLDGCVLFLQIDYDDVKSPVYEMFFYCIIAGIIVLAIIILIGMIFVDKIAKVENRIQIELRESKERAERANNAKSDFLASMSHEIRTPINAVLGMNEMILRDNKDKNIEEYATSIKVAGNTLLSLINDILDLSKISSGKLNVVNADYNTGSLINDIINMINLKASVKGLELKLDIDQTLPSVLYGDELRLKQVIMNILTNAVKYTKEGFVLFSIKALNITKSAITFRVSVQDTGIGIKPEDIPKLFDSFQRIDERKNKGIEGTGLGMPISNDLLHLMGSELKVISEYGKGSIFSFTLKQDIVNPNPIGDITKFVSSGQKAKQYIQKFTAPNANILIVDDVDMNLKVSLGLLKPLQMNIETAMSGEEAFEKCKNTMYDLIFMDYMMPRMNGIDATLLIRKELPLYANVPIVALTADAVTGANQKFIEAGMQDYVTKPINVEKIEKVLEKFLPKDKIHILTEQEIKSISAEIDTQELNSTLDLPTIDGIDTKKAINILGTIELFKDTLKLFYDSIDKKSELIEKYAVTNDFDNYTIQVHALKSMARSIAATQLADMAAHLEEKGKERNEEEIKNKTGELLQTYKEFKDKLLPYCATMEEETETELDVNTLKVKLDELADYINDFDIDKAEEWIKGISQNDINNYPELDSIKKYISEIKFNECKNEINNLLGKLI
ncbi:MAG: ATP-binding protein [Clostridia bacterium]|nr:ATP-binding protein [Clostridia bacterium]